MHVVLLNRLHILFGIYTVNKNKKCTWKYIFLKCITGFPREREILTNIRYIPAPLSLSGRRQANGNEPRGLNKHNFSLKPASWFLLSFALCQRFPFCLHNTSPLDHTFFSMSSTDSIHINPFNLCTC